MDGWKSYFFSMIACSLSCGIVSQMVSDPKQKEMMHLLCGLILAITIIKPLSQMNPADFQFVPTWNTPDLYISEGKKAASDALETSIKDSYEAYILNKAKELGTVLRAYVTVDEDLNPVYVELIGEVDSEERRILQKILTTDLGIPKENQEWIWNQESNSS